MAKFVKRSGLSGNRVRTRPRRAIWDNVDPVGVLLIGFVLLLVFFGGSSRYDQPSQLPVRLAAMVVIAVASFRSVAAMPRALRTPMMILGATILLVCLQLIPLPPALWTALPRRSDFVGLAGSAGFVQPWRPLAIAPDLAVNSLLALSIPAATLYGLAAQNGRRWRWIIPVLIGVVVASLVASIVQLITGTGGFSAIYRYGSLDDASGLFANRNHHAVLLAVGLPLIASWEQLRRHDRIGVLARFAVAALAALIVLVITATGSRAGLFCGALGLVGAIAVIWTWLRKRDAKTRRLLSLILLAVVGATVVLVTAALVFGRGEAVVRLVATDPLGDRRTRTLPTVIRMVKSYFPFGSGFGSFDSAFRRDEPFSLLEGTYFNEAHNDLLQVILEGGLPGLILMLLALSWFFKTSIQLWRSTSAGFVLTQGRGASVGLALMIVASAVDYPLRTPLMMAVGCALVFQMALAADDLRQSDSGLRDDLTLRVP